MSIPGVTPKKIGLDQSETVKKLFYSLACDLEVAGTSWFKDRYAELCNGKYATFVGHLGRMAPQTFESTTDENFRLYQLASLLSKYPFKDPSIDRKQAAVTKFLKSEHRCRRQNQKFLARRQRMEPAHMEFMRGYVAKVLGREIPFEQIFQHCDFGPGSSIGVSGEDVSFVTKLESLTVTPGCEPVARAALAYNRHYSAIIAEYNERNGRFPEVLPPEVGGLVQVTHVQHNNITSVPKNALTERTIAIEPVLNGFIQKGIDIVLRTRLRRIGVDLQTQSLNQALARRGSLYGTYATIDLSAASDSISIQLARELLPPAWFTLLNATRSPSYLLEGSKTPVRYEKFCSMGNGFCFPLQSLIYRAAVAYVMSVTHHSVHATCAVYGDDIIVPQECALLLLEVLADLGFRQNVSKTFIVGGFRESCGADYYEGVSCRPLFVKEPVRLDHSVFPLLNALRERKLKQAWKTLFESLPARHRYTRPFTREDDTAITVELDHFLTSKNAKWCRDTCRWTWKGIVQTPNVVREITYDVELMAGKLRGNLTYQEGLTGRDENAHTRVTTMS